MMAAVVEDEPVFSESEIIKLVPSKSYDFDCKIKLEHYRFEKIPGIYEFYIRYQNHTRWVEDIPSWIGDLKSNVIDVELH